MVKIQLYHCDSKILDESQHEDLKDHMILILQHPHSQTKKLLAHIKTHLNNQEKSAKCIWKGLHGKPFGYKTRRNDKNVR